MTTSQEDSSYQAIRLREDVPAVRAAERTAEKKIDKISPRAYSINGNSFNIQMLRRKRVAGHPLYQREELILGMMVEVLLHGFREVRSGAYRGKVSIPVRRTPLTVVEIRGVSLLSRVEPR